MNKLQRELEWRRCRSDPFYAARRYWKIKHPERGAVLLALREAQEHTLHIWLNEKASITLKARQIGFSTLAAFTMWHDTFFFDDRPEYALSKTEREAQKLLDKVKYGYERLPGWMRERGPELESKTLQKMAFANGSTIECLPATDPARGESAYKIFVDEWAFFENPEAAWSAIEPATDIGGRVHALSTANGAGNLFHQMWVKATTGGSDMVPIFFPWSAVPERDDAWYASKKRGMLEWQLHQEYPSNPDEAFIKSGNPVFDVDALRHLDTEEPQRGYLHPLSEKGTGTEFHFVGDGPLQVWEFPKPRSKYVIGGDVAEGLEHGDYSVAHVIDIDTGKVVAKWRGHIDPDLFGSEVLWYLGHYYNVALIGPEANNHGFTTITALKNKHYPNLYYRHSYDERTNKRTKKLGWMTTAKTKPLMIDELVRALRRGPVLTEEGEEVEESELQLLDDETIGELVTFVRDVDGKMHGSPFDDQTISLAIANQMRKHSFTLEAVTDNGPAPGTLDWYIAEADAAEVGAGDWVIGAGSVR
jgi:hypothetical protein